MFFVYYTRKREIMQPLLQIQNIAKSYKNKEVLHQISFEIDEKEILCLLGPNGAGKSTTMNILTGIMKADSGNLLYYDNNIDAHLKQYKTDIGVVPQDLALYNDLSAQKNVLFFASLYGLKGKELKKQCDDALAFTGLLKHADELVKTFSGGMKRRLNIACAIAHQPKLLLMDEPTVGIDPQSRDHILDGIQELRNNGMTVLYTTHYMEEVEKIATRIIIMDQGNIIAQGTLNQLKEKFSMDHYYTIRIADNDKKLDLMSMEGITGIKKITLEDSLLNITSDLTIENLDKIITELINQGIKIEDVNCKTANLETIFLSMTGKSLRD